MPSKTLSPMDWISLIIRFLYGAFFLYASIPKAMDPLTFLGSIRNFEIVPNAIVPLSGFLFIAVEAGIGIALVFGYFVRQTALAAAALMSIFAIAKVSAIVRKLDIACGCLLGEQMHVSWPGVFLDIGLIAIALLIAWQADKEYPWFSTAKAEEASS